MKRNGLHAWLSASLLAATAAGCQPEFDPGSELTGLRVMSVRKSTPYAAPGERVDLQLLWHDAGTEQREPRVPEIAWLAICENPASDLFELCLAQAPNLTPGDLAGRISLPSDAEGPNDRFSFTTSADIISSRPAPRDPTSLPYGLTYVFFAACAGSLTTTDDERFPFACFEERDGQGGFGSGDRELSSEDFVVGYSAVFSYAETTNGNPVMTGISVDGVTLRPEPPEGIDREPGVVYLPPRDLCLGNGCDAVIGEAPAEGCPAELTRPACDGDCSPFDLRPLVDPASAEVDDTTLGRRSGENREQMWINYYATDGSLSSEVRLLNDATRGWNEDPGIEYEPAAEPGVAHVWAVAHDNRGGADWARLRVCYE